MAAANVHKAATSQPDRPADASVQRTGRDPSRQDLRQQIDEPRCLESEARSRISSLPSTRQLAIPATRPETNCRIPKPSKVADAFPGGVAKFPNNPATAAGFEAIYKGGKRARSLIGGWEQNESGRPFYIHTGNKTGRILVYPNLKPNPEVPLTSPETLWHYVESLSPFTADVALAVLAQMCEPTVGDKPKFPMLQPVPVTADAILRYKGIRRRGAERKDLLRRVHDEMERLRQLTFDVESFTTFNPITKRFEKVSWEGDRLFEIVKVEASQASIGGETTNIEVAWLVRAGQWAFWWLSDQGRVYLGKIARVLLELDHRENRGPEVLAKKIGLRVLFLYYALRQPNQLKLRIGKLLEGIGELPRPDARDAHWSARTRENFEQAITTLGPGDSFVHGVDVFGKVDWPQGYGPDDSDRSKAWPEKWLLATISIRMPSSPTAFPEDTSEIASKDRRSRRAVAASGDEGIGPRLRSARLSCEPFWRQEDLAHHLGISPFYLSLIENNKRQPSEELVAKMGAWVESRRRQGS